MRHALLCTAVLGLLLAAAARAEVAVPEFTGHIVDLTDTLGSAERAALEHKLAAFEARTGSQVAVLILPTTRPETIEQYSLRVAEAWKLGRQGVDDGALLVVAKADRKLRIEVGYGLEGVLTDALSRRIIDEAIVPHFRRGDFYRGIDAGIDRMLALIEGEPLPAPQRHPNTALEGLLTAVPVILVFTVTLGSLLKALFGQLLGSAMTAGAVMLLTWLLLGILSAAVLAGVAAFLLTLFSRHRPARWSSGGGSGWSGRSSGGGFRGGGGGFGGGGASGRW